MDLPTALRHDLSQLTGAGELDEDAVGGPLAATVAALCAAVPSYRGMCLTAVENGHPIRVAAFVSPPGGQPIATSLRLPLAALAPGSPVDSRVVCYAATPGAFVDLAADLGHVLDLPTVTDPGADDRGDRSIVLDGDLPPAISVSGVTGLDDVSAINRAVGVLIEQGDHPQEAYADLRRRAAAAGVAVPVYAARLLRR